MFFTNKEVISNFSFTELRTNEDGNREREITRNSMKEIFRQNRTGTLVEVPVMMNSCVPMLNKSPPPPNPFLKSPIYHITKQLALI